MLAIVIPFISSAAANNYPKSCQLLRATLSSIVNQSSSSYRAYLVSEDCPPLLEEFSSIEFVHADTSSLSLVDFENYEGASKYDLPESYSRRHDEIKLNIMFKTMRGWEKAAQEGCSHILKLDADDLISNQLVEHTSGKDSTWGCTIQRGYIWSDGSCFVLKSNRLPSFNGSTNIIPIQMISGGSKSRNWNDYTILQEHSYTRKRAQSEYQVELQELPFRGLVVVKHDNNLSSSFFSSRLKSTALQFLKTLIYGTVLSSKLRKEFGMIKNA